MKKNNQIKKQFLQLLNQNGFKAYSVESDFDIPTIEALRNGKIYRLDILPENTVLSVGKRWYFENFSNSYLVIEDNGIFYYDNIQNFSFLDTDKIKKKAGLLTKALRNVKVENTHSLNSVYFNLFDFDSYIGYLGFDNPISKKQIVKFDSLENFLGDIEKSEEEGNEYYNLTKYSSIYDFIEKREGILNLKLSRKEAVDILFNATSSGNCEIFINKGEIYEYPL